MAVQGEKKFLSPSLDRNSELADHPMMLLEIARHMPVLNGKGYFKCKFMNLLPKRTLFKHSAKVYLDSLECLPL